MEQGYELLVAAIIKQAINDYARALKKLYVYGGKHREASYTLKEIEDFFHGKLYSTMTDIPGEIFLNKARKEFERRKKIKTPPSVLLSETKIKRIMCENGMKAKHMLEGLKMSTQTLYRIQHGRRVTLPTAQRIADALGVTVDDLEIKQSEK